MTYLADRDVQRAIWIVEEARPEHAKAVEVLNKRGLGQIWLVALRVIRIGASAPAPLFTIVVEPSEAELAVERPEQEPTPGQVKKRDFMAALFQQACDENIASPFRDLNPNINGIHHTPARGQGLLYRVAVNQKESRVVVTNVRGRWRGALDALTAKRSELDRAFATASLPRALEWPEQVNAGRWWIRYTVEANSQDKTDPAQLRELNHASAAMKRVFDPHLKALDPGLEEDADDSSDERRA